MVSMETHPQEENRRALIRLHPTDSIPGLVRIVRIADSGVKTKPGVIQLLDLSPGGCGFYSGLRLPLNPVVLWMVEWDAEGERFRLPGRLKWSMPDDNGFRYGMRYQLHSHDRLRLLNCMNRMVLRYCPGQAHIHSLYQSRAAGTAYRWNGFSS